MAHEDSQQINNCSIGKLRKQELKLSDGDYSFTVLSTDLCKYELLLPDNYTVIYADHDGSRVLGDFNIDIEELIDKDAEIIIVNHDQKPFYDWHIEGDEMKSARDAYAHTVHGCVAMVLLVYNGKIESISLYHYCDDINKKFLNLFQVFREDFNMEDCILEKEYKYDI